MASSLLTFQPAGVRACATSGQRGQDLNRRKTSSFNSSGWWTPLFGWSAEPAYIDASDDDNSNNQANQEKSETARSDSDRSSKFAPGCFTEEKARQLRLMTKESKSFHDAMYHSAIASRLATDLIDRSHI